MMPMLRRFLLLVILLLGSIGTSHSQTLNDLWRGALLNCGGGQPCLNITNVATAVPFTTPQTLNDLMKGAFQNCAGTPCLTVTGAGGGGGGVTSVTGTANQISASPTTGAVTLSLVGPYTPATYTAHGVLLGEGTSSIVATPVMTNGQLLIGATGADPAPQTVSGSGATISLGSTGVLTISAIPNATLSNSSITLNAGTNVGLTTPGAVALGGTGVLGNTGDKVQLGALGLGVAAPTVVGQASLTETASTGTVAPQLTLTGGAHTALTASTERFDISLPAVTHQWATGALTLQERVRLVGETLQAVAASTFSEAATLSVTGPIKSTNVTATQLEAILVPTWGCSTATTCLGLTVNAPSGATNNNAAAFLGGNVGIGTATPGKTLDVTGSSGVAARVQNTGGQATLLVDAGAGAGVGPVLELFHSSVLKSLVGSDGTWVGSGSQNNTDLALVSTVAGGKIRMYPNNNGTVGSQVLTVANNVVVAGQGDATGALTTATVRGGNADGATSNVTGGGLTLQPGLNSGSAVPAFFNMQGGALGTASGATVHTAVSRHTVNTTKILTNNSAIAIVNATVASNTVAMQAYTYGVEVFNGTDLQFETGTITCGAVNKGGVFSGNSCSTKANNINFASTGTLVVTFAITAANPAVVSVNANSSLTPNAGYPRIVYEVANMSQNDIAIQ